MENYIQKILVEYIDLLKLESYGDENFEKLEKLKLSDIIDNLKLEMKEDYFFEGPPDDSVYNYGIAKRLYVQLGKVFIKRKTFHQ